MASGLLIGVGGLIPASTMAAAGSLAPSPTLVAAIFGLITQASSLGQLVTTLPRLPAGPTGWGGNGSVLCPPLCWNWDPAGLQLAERFERPEPLQSP